jgi:hypothetical protein
MIPRREIAGDERIKLQQILFNSNAERGPPHSARAVSYGLDMTSAWKKQRLRAITRRS